MARKARRTHAAGYVKHRMSIQIDVRRDLSMTGHPRFSACAFIRGRSRAGSNLTCLPGRTPRQAVANVMRRQARLISGRRGAFAGLGG